MLTSILDQHPQPHPLLQPHPLFNPRQLPPQNKRRRIIQMQLSLPQPLPPNTEVPLHPQLLLQRRQRMIIHMHDDIPPHSLPHPPQFVAAKSLIFNSSKNHLQYNCMCLGLTVLHSCFKNICKMTNSIILCCKEFRLN